MSACENGDSQPEQFQATEQTTVQPTTMSEEEINDQKLDRFISNMKLEEKAEILTEKPKMKLLTVFKAIRMRQIFRF